MEEVFIQLFNMGMTATWTVLAVVLVRGLLRRAPKAYAVALWALVGVRLVCPVLIESVLSLIPSAEIVSPDILMAEQPTIYTGVNALNSVVNPVMSEHLAPTAGDSVNPMQVLVVVASLVWAAGVMAMLLYSLISYLRMRRKVKVSLCYRDNIYFCDAVTTPFIFGILNPRIYVPSGMEKTQLAYVVAHEQAHIKRKDHLWKPLGFFLLSVYWFNPALWLAYVLFARDIEFACDEKVIKEMDGNARKGYAEALVACSMQKRTVFVCPLAFGEVGVKNRIKSVRNYKKPAFWIVLLAVVAGALVAVCFLTNPKTKEERQDSLAIIGGADGPTVILVGSTSSGARSLKQLWEYCPEYFERSTVNGLEVYVWQLAENHYSCGVLEGTTKERTHEELWGSKSVSIEEMRLILSTYGISKEEIQIIPYPMPHSSYLYTIDEDYQKNLEAMFWEE